jgi:hypothetical protein
MIIAIWAFCGVELPTPALGSEEPLPPPQAPRLATIVAHTAARNRLQCMLKSSPCRNVATQRALAVATTERANPPPVDALFAGAARVNRLRSRALRSE